MYVTFFANVLCRQRVTSPSIISTRTCCSFCIDVTKLQSYIHTHTGARARAHIRAYALPEYTLDLHESLATGVSVKKPVVIFEKSHFKLKNRAKNAMRQ